MTPYELRELKFDLLRRPGLVAHVQMPPKGRCHGWRACVYVDGTTAMVVSFTNRIMHMCKWATRAEAVDDLCAWMEACNVSRGVKGRGDRSPALVEEFWEKL